MSADIPSAVQSCKQSSLINRKIPYRDEFVCPLPPPPAPPAPPAPHPPPSAQGVAPFNATHKTVTPKISEGLWILRLSLQWCHT